MAVSPVHKTERPETEKDKEKLDLLQLPLKKPITTLDCKKLDQNYIDVFEREKKEYILK